MRKIKWGVMGTADIAESTTIPGMMQAENCELYAIAGRKAEKAEAFQKKFGFEKAYGSYEELLEDPEVEAVYMPLPNTLHCEWAIKALEAGKHVLCEKPMAMTVEECSRMIETADKNGVFVMEAFAYLHSPYIRMLKEEIQNGSIGDVLYMENAFITAEHDISNIRMRRETGGGALYDLGCYTISEMLWLLGEEPEKVQAIAEFSDENIDIYATGILKFKDRKYASFDCGMVLPTEAATRIERMRIEGTEGTIRSWVQYNEAGELSYTICKDGMENIKTVSVPDNYMLEIEQFGKCVAGEETPHVSNEFSMRTTKVIEETAKKMGYL